MALNKKFYVGILKVRNGEYEYEHHIRMALNTRSKPEIALERHAKSFYSGDHEKENGGYYFHCGCVFVSIGEYKEITEQTYHDLNGIIVSL